MTSDDLRSHFEVKIGNLNQKLINFKRIFYWNTKQPLLYPIECFHPPIRLLIFSKKSHLYFYLEPSSIRNSRVHTFADKMSYKNSSQKNYILHTRKFIMKYVPTNCKNQNYTIEIGLPIGTKHQRCCPHNETCSLVFLLFSKPEILARFKKGFYVRTYVSN